MKKSLLLALCCIFLSVSFVNAKTKTEADIFLKSNLDKSLRPTALTATSSIVPVTASVDGGVVTVKFSSSLGSTQITIEDPNGEVAYETTVNVQGTLSLPISLAGGEAGTYFIQIKTASKTWYGEFDLN